MQNDVKLPVSGQKPDAGQDFMWLLHKVSEMSWDDKPVPVTMRQENSWTENTVN